MWITNGAEALVTAGKFHFLALIRCAGANDGDNGNEGIDVAHIAHFAKRDHSRAFNVMHGAGAAAGDEIPDFGVVPRTHGGWKSEVRSPKVEIRSLKIEGRRPPHPGPLPRGE